MILTQLHQYDFYIIIGNIVKKI